ncbi:hypothetical protein K466DRAFT_602840 [Polyporus arcularius HHB13444]|uniref:Fungal-type protein kinase domain-containing protein n=1 Tax=Polyporus arcularius HHB13444 TaxID=1314778 RepID=A0A5C3P2G8_9APHY|nr:hypothetical protein K466DRAFT_602840 [Polyporus arcularius HHB13444]
MSDVQPAPVPCPDHAGDALDAMKEQNSLSAEGIASISGRDFPEDMTMIVRSKGTAIFMSQRVLYAAIQQRHIVRTTEDDLESFGWIVFYAIYRHALQDEEGLERIKTELAKFEATHSKIDTAIRQEFRDEFNSIFSATSVRDLHSTQAGHLGRHFCDLFPYLWAYAVRRG